MDCGGRFPVHVGDGFTAALASMSSTNGPWTIPLTSVNTEVPFSLPPANHEVTICHENWYVTCGVLHNMEALYSSYNFCYLFLPCLHWLKAYLTHLNRQTFSAKNTNTSSWQCVKASTENVVSATLESLENNSFKKRSKALILLEIWLCDHILLLMIHIIILVSKWNLEVCLFCQCVSLMHISIKSKNFWA